MKPFNQDNDIYFVLANGKEYAKDSKGQTTDGFGMLSFNSYTDVTNAHKRGAGLAVQYVISRDKFGNPKGKNFTISQSRNAFKVRKDDKDVTGLSMYEFLAAHPQCEGSPNGTYVDGRQVDVVFKVMNNEADATVALEAAMNTTKAKMSALELDEQTLAEVASIGIGFHGNPDALMRHRVVEWADKRPLDYFKVLDSGDRFLRAVIRKAIKENLIEVRGTLHYWGNELLGGSEDAAIAYLTANSDAETALKEAVDLKKPVEKKNTGGRPRKNS